VFPLYAAAPVVPEKIAPVQGYVQGIPWSLHLEAYNAYCARWSPQPALIDLEGRGCRGGFHVSELDEFVPGWRDRVCEIGQLKARVAELESSRATAAEMTLVPIEPTVSMVVDGFEAVFKFHQTDEYHEMAGCKGAAESAKICYAAMIAAAPTESK
jgi:hypothetical protein